MAPQLHTLAEEFRWNADRVFPDASRLYQVLARRVADDPALLALAAHAQPHQPSVQLLFAAVHYLLLRDPDDPLSLFFADLARKPNTQDDPFPIFRAYSLEHAAEIAALVGTRRVQTNEVGRCALFLPGFQLIARQVEFQPCAQIEVGSSAGLNLNWEHYSYDYGDGLVWGDVAAPLRLRCELRGAYKPPLTLLPDLRAAQNGARPLRIGIDIQPNDVNDDDAMLWLRALVWPEQLERAERLARAIALARQFPPQVVQGDALELLPTVLADIPRATPVVLFHSYVLNQFSATARLRYQELLAAHSAGRLLFDLAIEPKEWPAPLVLTRFHDGDRTTQELAVCDQHGRWLEWLESGA